MHKSNANALCVKQMWIMSWTRIIYFLLERNIIAANANIENTADMKITDITSVVMSFQNIFTCTYIVMNNHHSLGWNKTWKNRKKASLLEPQTVPVSTVLSELEQLRASSKYFYDRNAGAELPKLEIGNHVFLKPQPAMKGEGRNTAKSPTSTVQGHILSRHYQALPGRTTGIFEWQHHLVWRSWSPTMIYWQAQGPHTRMSDSGEWLCLAPVE